ncbi:MAG: bifunctional aspartate kinase/homoserine dehydrogenase I [Microscillaceae bacterium]|nr:bifunctional aspartate kinase/homoserine dehydrogenase I [Microscillaceae bacterium]
MKVLKFGGSSVQTAERIKNVIEIIREEKSARAVVCSALGGITDQLIQTGQLAANQNPIYLSIWSEIQDRHLVLIEELIHESEKEEIIQAIKTKLLELENVLRGVFLLREFNARASDYVSSFGERLSCYIIAAACRERGIQAEYLDTRKVIITNEDYGVAQVNFSLSNENIQKYFLEHPNLQIITGFIASTPKGITSTLGRGGSDYTASIFAAALMAEELEIWTDVDGVMTADPRKVSKAFSIERLSYEEAMELSHFGAKVIYGPTMAPVLQKDIPIRIRNTFNPAFPGTLVSADSNGTKRIVKGITSVGKVAMVNVWGGGMVGISGVSARLFGALAREKVNVILISQASSEHSICFAIKPEDAQRAKEALEQEFDRELSEGSIYRVEVTENLCIIAAVGENMHHSSGVAAKFFTALGKNGINIRGIAQGSSELNISVVIQQEDEVKALRTVHQAFFLSDIKTIHLFVVGVGLIGGTFLKQLSEQQQYLLDEYKLEVKVIGLSNSKKQLFMPEGITLKYWQEHLSEALESADIDQFIWQMTQLNLINSVFIDNTASAKIAHVYEKILQRSISIITPNKIASSSSQELYQTLKKTAKKHNVLYLYETNVGASLPVLSTLKDLIDSGDRILKIEAILSGTLSYIFNTFDGKTPFSQVVRKAKELGYTEPDPREDLNGSDVGRKILILARECGYTLEFEEVEIKAFLPENCMQAASVDDFFKELSKSDDYFKEMHRQVAAEGKVLRYIARFENHKAEISLQAVDQNHPFYIMQGSDNILAFTSLRYPERPLVIKGSGAGAEVTAAGVFADLMRVANYL